MLQDRFAQIERDQTRAQILPVQPFDRGIAPVDVRRTQHHIVLCGKWAAVRGQGTRFGVPARLSGSAAALRRCVIGRGLRIALHAQRAFVALHVARNRNVILHQLPKFVALAPVVARNQR